MYSIPEALDYLKWKIERMEKEMKSVKGKWAKRQKEHEIEREFEWGIRILSWAKPHEVNSTLIDWYFGRIDERPDITRLKKKLAEKDELEKNAQTSLLGRLKLWRWKIKKEIRYWSRIK